MEWYTSGGEAGLMWFDSLILSGCLISEWLKGKQQERKKQIKIFTSEWVAGVQV